jgi:pimeloyl-ACP methyl ester carboxylesterase
MKCKLENTTIYYKSKGKGRPLIMIHGFTLDHRMMLGCMEPVFSKRSGWQRIYFDLPGMGKTPGADSITNSDQMLEVVLEFVDAIVPNQQIVVAGESYGGYLSRGIIYRRPQSVVGQLLICPLIVAQDKLRRVPTQVKLVEDPKLISSLDPYEAEFLQSFNTVVSPRIWARTRDEILSGHKIVDSKFTDRLRGEKYYPFSFDVDELADAFKGPTLVLLGRQDWFVGYRDALKLLELYPRGTFAILDRAAHNLQIEQEQLFNALVGEWLDRVEEAADMK